MGKFRSACCDQRYMLTLCGGVFALFTLPLFVLTRNSLHLFIFICSCGFTGCGIYGYTLVKEVARRQARLEAVAREALNGMLTGLQYQAERVFDIAVELSNCVPNDPEWNDLSDDYREKYKEFWRQADDFTDELNYDFVRHFKSSRYRMDDQLELISRIESCAPDDPRLPGLCAKLRELSNSPPADEPPVG